MEMTVKEVRTALKLTQKEMAGRLFVSASTIEAYEHPTAGRDINKAHGAVQHIFKGLIREAQAKR